MSYVLSGLDGPIGSTVNIFVQFPAFDISSFCVGRKGVLLSIGEDFLTNMEKFEILQKNAHPIAKKILKEDFFWSLIEESGPFGNDDGFETFQGFWKWRSVNKHKRPLEYIDEVFIAWAFPSFDLEELDTGKVEKYILAKRYETSQEPSPSMTEYFRELANLMGNKFYEEEFREAVAESPAIGGDTYLLCYDNAIIAVGFGQFVLEGRIDEDMKNLTKIALQRELLPVMLQNWESNYQKIRKDQLVKMLAVLDSI